MNGLKNINEKPKLSTSHAFMAVLRASEMGYSTRQWKKKRLIHCARILRCTPLFYCSAVDGALGQSSRNTFRMTTKCVSEDKWNGKLGDGRPFSREDTLLFFAPAVGSDMFVYAALLYCQNENRMHIGEWFAPSWAALWSSTAYTSWFQLWTRAFFFISCAIARRLKYSASEL